jgi:hypothetical protein
MAVVVVCSILVLAGVVAVLRWGGLSVEPPVVSPEESGAPDGVPSVGHVLRMYLWFLTVGTIAGLGAGIVAAGAGGRLAMRLLAVTAGSGAQGQLTEAEEVVGRITADGTLGFVIFVGLFAGLFSALLYLLVRRWLPSGRAGGLVFGALLLVLASTRVDPLRGDNPDFDLVGPGWVSVAVFAALTLLHGMVVAALAGRVSRAVPLIGTNRLAIALHAPPLLFYLLLARLGIILILVGAVAVGVTRSRAVVNAWRSRNARVVGWAAWALLALVAAPGFVATAVDILGRA